MIVRQYKGGHTRQVNCIATTEDHVFTGSDDHTVRMWERKNKSLPDRLYIAQRVEVRYRNQWYPGTIVRDDRIFADMGLSPYRIKCDNGVSTGAKENDIRVLPLAVGSKAVWTKEDEKWIECVVEDVVRDDAGKVIAYDIKEVDSGRTASNANSRRVRRYEENAFEFWERERRPIGEFRGHRGSVSCMCFTKDRKGLITGSWDKTIIHWTISNQEKVRTFRGHSSLVLSVDTYGDLLVSGGEDNILILWDINKGDRLRDLRGHKFAIHCVRFSSDGKSVFSGSADETVIRWKADVGPIDHETLLRLRIEEVEEELGRVKKANSVLTDKLKSIRKVNDRTQIMKYEGGHTSKVMSLALTRDDSKLITGSLDCTCIIWNVLSGAQLNIFRANPLRHGGVYSNGVFSVDLSPCERYFASGNSNRVTIIWDIAKVEPIHVLAGHKLWVQDVMFAGHSTLLTASSDGSAIEYDITPLLKDIPARIEFLLAIERLYATWNRLSKEERADISAHQEALFDLALGIHPVTRTNIRKGILSYI